MNPIGGYFELADREEGVFPHAGGVLLNTGRNALEYILRTLDNIRKIYLPYYTCEVVLEPINKLSIPYQFYHINERLEIATEINLGEGEYLIANNYFGIKDDYIQMLADQYKERLIVDCAQAFFDTPIPGIKMFYSCRKFVGVADGGVAYVPRTSVRPKIYGEDNTTEHDSHLYTRKQFGAEVGFKEFQENECKLDNQPIKQMSDQTRDILEHIDYEKIFIERRENFLLLQKELGKGNKLSLSLSPNTIPMIYPFWIHNGADLRGILISNKVFCARYWPNVLDWSKNGELEYELAQNLIAIPCDHRYGIADMERIVKYLL